MSEQPQVAPRKSILAVSPDVTILERRLLKAQIGDLITYEEMEKLVSRNIRGDGAYVLASARRRVLAQHGVVFGTIRGEGIKRLNDSEIVTTGESTLRSIRRKANKEARRQVCIKDFDKLPPELRAKHQATISLLGVMSLFAKPKTLDRVEKAVAMQRDQLSIGKTLSLFTNGST